MKVMKFGGSSVDSAKKIMHVAGVIKKFSAKDTVVVIVSAMEGVTDTLITIFKKHKAGKSAEGLSQLDELCKERIETLKELQLNKVHYLQAKRSLSRLFDELARYLRVYTGYSTADYDYVVSFGERLSSISLAAAAQTLKVAAEPVDSSNVIVTDTVFNNAKPLLPKTIEQAQHSLVPLLNKKIVPIVSGFFGATRDGKVATLGRGGSDYSATVLAYVLDATEVIIWKEVDGVYNTDPEKDCSACFFTELSYQEALEFARNGAKVLHPEAMKPISSKEIIVR